MGTPTTGPDRKRYLRNYLLDARFQLKFTFYIVAIALCVACILVGFLWSTSKRLLEEAGYTFRCVVPSQEAECGICSGESPAELVARLARQKAQDVAGQLLVLGFFLTPVLYDRGLLPEAAARWLRVNPLVVPVESVRRALSGDDAVNWLALGTCALLALALLWLANRFFRAARSHLEDFL